METQAKNIKTGDLIITPEGKTERVVSVCRGLQVGHLSIYWGSNFIEVRPSQMVSIPDVVTVKET